MRYLIVTILPPFAVVGALTIADLGDIKTIYKEASKLRAECGKELPRNQECEIIITAVVKEEKK